MAGLVPAIHAGNASKTGPTWGGPQQSFAGTKLSPLPRSRTFDAPNHVDSRDKPAMTPSSSSGDPLITPILTTNSERDKSHNVRSAIGGDGLPVGSAHSVRVALVARSRRRHSDPSRRGPRRARPISWLGSSRAGHKVAAVKRREFFARRALAFNTAELIAFHWLSFPRKPSFCDGDHSAPRKFTIY
jgi:hypothetical protein